MSRRRRGLRYKGVEVGDDLAMLTGTLFVAMLLLAVLAWLWDLIQGWLP